MTIYQFRETREKKERGGGGGGESPQGGRKGLDHNNKRGITGGWRRYLGELGRVSEDKPMTWPLYCHNKCQPQSYGRGPSHKVPITPSYCRYPRPAEISVPASPNQWPSRARQVWSTCLLSFHRKSWIAYLTCNALYLFMTAVFAGVKLRGKPRSYYPC